MASVLLAGGLLLSVACFQQIPRTDVLALGSDPTPSPTPTPPPTLTPTPAPPRPTPTPTLTPPTAVPPPVVTPDPTPTATPLPPLFLELDEPAFGSTVRTDTVTVVGRTLPTARLQINSRRVTVDLNGRFESEVGLRPGQNVIVAVSTGDDGSQLRDFLTIIYNVPPPFEFFLLVDQPLDNIQVVNQIIDVSGTTAPRAKVTVNGVGVRVNDLGEFSTPIQLRPGNNNVRTVSTDTDGKTLTSVLRVLFVP